MNLTDKFVDEIYKVGTTSYNERTSKLVTRCLLDYVGVTYAGAKMLEDKANKILILLSSDKDGHKIIGLDAKSDLNTAILINGLFSHVAELDDGVRYGMLHPGAPIFSALLPLARNRNVTYEDFVKGVVAAYETSIRIARAIQPSHYGLGYHPTATCGSIGAAAGISVMLRQSKKQLKDAISAAAISSSGTLKVIENSSQIKPFNVGRSSVIGYMSFLMSEAGFDGPQNVLEGDIGFLSIMSKDYDVNELIKLATQDNLSIELTYFKPYAACRHAHPSIEAVSKMLFQGLKADEVQSIVVHTYGTILGKHDKKEVYGVSSAKMSIPFSIALTLCKGGAGINDFTEENVNDQRIIDITNRVEIKARKEFTDLVPDKRVALVEVTSFDGRIYSEQVDFPKGEPENQLTDSEFEAKFEELLIFSETDSEKIAELKNSILHIETEFKTLLNLL